MRRGVFFVGWRAVLLAVLALAGCEGLAWADTTPEVMFSSQVEGRPGERTDDISQVTGTSVHFKGEVNPEDGPSETHWEFVYATEAQRMQGKWQPVPGASGVLPGTDAVWHVVEADLTGLTPGTVYYSRLVATNEGGAKEEFEPHNPFAGRFVTTSAPKAATFATHALQGKAMRGLGEVNPGGASTVYYVEYVTRESFEESGWAEAERGMPPGEIHAEPEIGEFEDQKGSMPRIVGQDLQGLSPGKTYVYRFVAVNENGQSTGIEHVLTVPVASSEDPVAVCPNEAVRVGASARLPDCRAYEQVTPVEKRGAQDIYRYGLIGENNLIGKGGEHFELHAPAVQWGTSPDSAVSNYFFSRTPEGWRMISATPQTAGLNSFSPTVFSADLGQIGAEVGWLTTQVAESESVEYVTGRPGGPYTSVATVPREMIEQNGGWVAESADGSKLILEVEDHTLLGPATGTTSGPDLYEYAKGELRQVNVQSSGEEISACGAKLEHLKTGVEGGAAISVDGSHVFFTDNCTGDLYARIDGAETVDIGEYTLYSVDSTGNRLLLERKNGALHELVLYEIGPADAVTLVTTSEKINGVSVVISGDFTTLYFASRERLTPEAPSFSSGLNAPADIYRYDIETKTLSFVVQAEANENGAFGLSTSPEGRYLYMQVLPGVAGILNSSGKLITGVYRYDDAERAIECITCASSFDPEPAHLDKMPEASVTTDGSYVFFDTVATLVPQDVDGEVAPEPIRLENGAFSEHPSNFYSVSSDVYEWRRNGLDGCDRIGGCVSLLSSGRGGFKNVLLGASPDGRDVFLGTHEELVQQDEDTAGDVYDARIGGGYPPRPPRPVECEGDACDTPLAAPIDTTPSSLTFTGPGNAKGAAKATMPKKTVKSRKHKHKKGHQKGKRRKTKASAKRNRRKP
jgi:hypothetical protein